MIFNAVNLEDLGAEIKNAIAGGPFGSNLVSKDYAESGVPVIRGQNMGEKWVTGDFVFVSEEKAKSLSQNKARPGDLVFTQRGTLGQVSIVPEEPYAEYIVSQSQMKITLDPAKADVHFIYYLFKTKEQLQYILNSSIQTGVPHTNLGILRKTPVTVPPVSIQRSIANMLGLLDERITLLRETNSTLEAIAQALFKSWFVDFDPVHAKQRCQAPEGMDDATASLFPDDFEESELGLVPKGWNIGTVDSICKAITNGGTPSRSKKEFWDGGAIPWFKTGDFSDGFLLSPTERITEEALKSSAAKLLPEHSVLMAIYAAPTVGRLGILTESATFNQACTGMVAKDNVGPWFLYWTLYFGRQWFNNRANGAAQQNISKAIVTAYRTIVPPDTILNAFNEVAGVIYKKIRLGSERAANLASIRDTLLPRLVSGELPITDAENMVEEAIA